MQLKPNSATTAVDTAKHSAHIPLQTIPNPEQTPMPINCHVCKKEKSILILIYLL